MKVIDSWKRWAKRLRVDSFALCHACKDRRTPWYARLLSLIVAAYAFSPIDLIPDFIPILGYLDDLVLVPLGIAIVIKLIPSNVMTESRRWAEKHIDEKKPVNWIIGGIIIGIWVAFFAFIFYKIIAAIATRAKK